MGNICGTSIHGVPRPRAAAIVAQANAFDSRRDPFSTSAATSGGFVSSSKMAVPSSIFSENKYNLSNIYFQKQSLIFRTTFLSFSEKRFGKNPQVFVDEITRLSPLFAANIFRRIFPRVNCLSVAR